MNPDCDMIILCTHNDGGVGKTTLAIHATGALQSQLGRILLIDCDDQADSWQFYADGIPRKSKDVLVKDEISLIWNNNRESIKRLTKPEQYDHVVLDMDSPLQNTVKLIVDNEPDLVLVPVNTSQAVKALRNLPRTLSVIGQLEAKTGASPRTIVVPLGVDPNDIREAMAQATDKPSRCLIAPPMPDLQQEMQVALYQDKKYIWNYPGHENLQTYFYSLLFLES
jgi:chromosome partitioning protein